MHIVSTKVLRFSTWRLFGWGMYATPDVESHSQISIVYVTSPYSDAEVKALYHRTQEILRSSENSRACVLLFAENTVRKSDIIQLPSREACHHPEIDDHLDYFYQFGSTKHLMKLVQLLTNFTEKKTTEAFVFHTFQRIDVLRSKAYTEYIVYRVQESEKQKPVIAGDPRRSFRSLGMTETDTFPLRESEI